MKTSTTEQGMVLVVEDQPAEMQVLISSLHECGLTILVAQHGEHVLDLATQFTPDMILLDVHASGIDAFEICRRLRSHGTNHDIPVLFIVSSDEMIAQVKRLDVGAVDYLTTPFQPAEIMARVTAHLTIRKLQHQLQECHPLEENPQEWFHQSQEIKEMNMKSGQESSQSRTTLPPGQRPEPPVREDVTFREAIEAYEKRLIINVLEQNSGNTSETAIRLAIPLRTLYRKIKKYRLLRHTQSP